MGCRQRSVSQGFVIVDSTEPGRAIMSASPTPLEDDPIKDPDALMQNFERLGYIADRSLATSIYLIAKLQKPLLIEGHAGLGKTEIAKVLASTLGAELIRLQCYEGLDVNLAAYEWNYARQMLEIRLGEATHESREHIAASLFSERFLIARPLLRALQPQAVPPA